MQKPDYHVDLKNMHKMYAVYTKISITFKMSMKYTSVFKVVLEDRLQIKNCDIFLAYLCSKHKS